MRVKFWGARGSIPVSGPEYLEFGGDTTCVEVLTSDGKTIIIDAGSAVRRLGNQLIEERRLNVHLLFTHAHWDHLLGFPYFKLIYRKDAKVTLYGCPFAQQSVERMIADTMEPPYFPLQFFNVRADLSFRGLCTDGFTIGSVHIRPILLSHPNQGLGYKLTEDGKDFVFLTDNELGHLHPGGCEAKTYTEFARDAELLVHDAEFSDAEYASKKTWGHSTYQQAVSLALDADVKRLGLFHHNQERTDDQVRDIVADCGRLIRERGGALECFAVSRDQVIEL